MGSLIPWTEEKFDVNVFSGSNYMDGGMEWIPCLQGCRVAGWLGGILSSLRVVQCVVSVVSVVSVVHNNKPNVSFLLCSLLAADTNTAQHHNNITALIFISTHLSLQSVADIHPNFK